MPFIKHYSQPALVGILRGAAIANTYQGKERAAFMRALVAVALACGLGEIEQDDVQRQIEYLSGGGLQNERVRAGHSNGEA